MGEPSETDPYDIHTLTVSTSSSTKRSAQDTDRELTFLSLAFSSSSLSSLSKLADARLLTFNLPAGFVRPPAAGLLSSLMLVIYSTRKPKQTAWNQIGAVLLSKSVPGAIITAAEKSDASRAPYTTLVT